MDKYTQPRTDEKLIKQLQKGDRHAFEIIYNKYVKRLYLTAYSILQDEDICKKLIQDIFVQLWIKREEANIMSLENYLLTDVRDKVLKAMVLKATIEDNELLVVDHGQDKFTNDGIACVLEHRMTEVSESMVKYSH